MDDRQAGQTVLIASLGERDPDGQQRRNGAAIPLAASIPSPTGPLLCARRYRPGRVYLLAAEGVERQAALTRDAIARETDVVPEVRPLAGDPSSFDAMQTAMETVLRAIRGEIGSADQVVVCPSSGTPQIGQALVIVAMYVLPRAQIVQALDPRHVPAEAQRLRPFDPSATRARFDLERAARALIAGHWAVAADLFAEVEPFGSQVVRKQARAIATACQLARGLQRADNLDFAGAAKELTPVATRVIGRHLDPLKQWYHGLARGGQGRPERPRELAAMAARHRRAEATSRATVTAAMAWESAIAVGLRTRCGLNPDDLARGDLERLGELRADVREVNGRRRLEGQRLRWQAWAQLDPGAAALLPAERLAAIEKLVEQRNRLVHTGAQPEADLDRTLAAALEVLDGLFVALEWEAWHEAPTAPERLAQLTRQLAADWLPAAG